MSFTIHQKWSRSCLHTTYSHELLSGKLHLCHKRARRHPSPSRESKPSLDTHGNYHQRVHLLQRAAILTPPVHILGIDQEPLHLPDELNNLWYSLIAQNSFTIKMNGWLTSQYAPKLFDILLWGLTIVILLQVITVNVYCSDSYELYIPILKTQWLISHQSHSWGFRSNRQSCLSQVGGPMANNSTLVCNKLVMSYFH